MQNTKSMVHIIRVSSIKKNSSTSGDSTEKKSATTTVTHGKWFMITELQNDSQPDAAEMCGMVWWECTLNVLYILPDPITVLTFSFIILYLGI